jgi:hypothetical protein
MKAIRHIAAAALVLCLLTACENMLVQELLRSPVYFTSLELRYGIAGVGGAGSVLDPSFDPRTTSYTVVIPFEADTITLRGSGEDATYAIQSGAAGTETLNGSGVFALPLDVEEAVLTVTASRKYMTSTQYRISVRRGEAAARLADLGLFTNNITAGDTAAFETADYLGNFFPPGLAYVITVPYYATRLKFNVEPWPGGHVDYKQLVDGAENAAGALTGTDLELDFPGSFPSCRVELTVRGLGGGMDDSVYVIEVNRGGYTAYLSHLKVHAGTALAGEDFLGKSQSFVPSGGIYQATVPFATADISLDAAAAIPGSTLEFFQSDDYAYDFSIAATTNSGTWTPVSAANPPTFPFGTNKASTALRIEVSSSSPSLEPMFYTVLIRREVLPAELAGISVKEMQGGSPLPTELFTGSVSADTLAYSLQLENTVETVRIIAAPESGGSVSCRRDGSGTFDPVPGGLTFPFIGRTVVEIRVTAPLKSDRTYMLTLVRIGVNDIVVPLDTHVPGGLPRPAGKVRATALAAGVPVQVSNSLPGEVITLTVQANVGYKITALVPDTGIALSSIPYVNDATLDDGKVHPDPASSSGDTKRVWKFKMPDNLVRFDVSYTHIAEGNNRIAYVAAVPDADRPYRRSSGLGHSWADASTDLQDTINRYYTNGVDASGGTNYDAIWVAKGTYYPESWAEGITGDGQTGTAIAPDSTHYGIRAADRDSEGTNKSFVLRPGLKIYGGFEGTEGPAHSPESAGHDRAKTVLSGGYRSCHVVLAVGISGTSGTVLHSLTIAKGQGSTSGDGAIETGGVKIYQRSGAGVYNHNASPAFTNVIIENNRAAVYGGQFKSAYATDTMAYGAGVYNIATGGGAATGNGVCSPTFTDVTIQNNTIVGSGGGMANLAYTPGTGNICQPVLSGVRIQNNISSGSRGGGIYNYANNATTGNALCAPQIKNSLIRQNSANIGGGVSNYASARPFFERVRIEQNTAGNGGGVHDENCRSRYTDVIIKGNSATSAGGGMVNNYSYTTMTYVSINGNTAGNGGWGSAGGIYTLQSRLIMTNAIIENNTAAAEAGGIHLRNDNSNENVAGILILTNGKITGNQSTHGGGLFNYLMVESSLSHSGYVCAVLTNVVIAGNTATNSAARGGGIENRVSGAYGTARGRFTNVTIANNQSQATPPNSAGGGGGIANFRPVFNPFDPGASDILAARYDIRFNNSIIWDNTDGLSGTDTDNIKDPFIETSEYNGVTVYNKSLVKGKTDADLDGSGPSALTGSGNLNSGGYSGLEFDSDGEGSDGYASLLNVGDNDKYPPTTSAPAAAAFLLDGLTGTWRTAVIELLTGDMLPDDSDIQSIDHFLKSDARSAVGARYDWDDTLLAADPDSNYTGRIKNNFINPGAYEE